MKMIININKIDRKDIFLALTLLPAVLLLPVTLWSISFGFIAGYFGLLIITTGIILGVKLRLLKTGLLTPVVWIGMNILLLWSTVATYNAKRELYFEKIRQNRGLTFIEKCNVYGLNIAMSVIALPFRPEVAMESLGLISPAKNGVRKFNSTFFLRSEKILKMVLDGKVNDGTRVTWSRAEYAFGHPESRYALALNPCTLRMIRSSVFEAKVRVGYPMRSEVVLLNRPVRITVEEGLFGYLQEVGWLHPYYAVWVGVKR